MSEFESGQKVRVSQRVMRTSKYSHARKAWGVVPYWCTATYLRSCGTMALVEHDGDPARFYTPINSLEQTDDRPIESQGPAD